MVKQTRRGSSAATGADAPQPIKHRDKHQQGYEVHQHLSGVVKGSGQDLATRASGMEKNDPAAMNRAKHIRQR